MPSDAYQLLARIDGQPLTVPSVEDAVAAMVRRCREGSGFTLFTLNLDHLVKRRRHVLFRQAYERATFVTPDGAPIVAMARRQGVKVERTTGADLVVPLCEAAADAGLPVFLFGSTRAVLLGAAERLHQRIPGLEIRGLEAPPFGFDPLSPEADEAIERIAGSGARLCFVALGAPKQELFADRAYGRSPELGFLCVGAALDFIAGAQTRAPRVLRRAGLEWAWRLMCNPRRLWDRYAACALLLVRLGLIEPAQRRFARRSVPAE